MLFPKIISQQKTFVIINKPSGLVVNRAETVKGKTLQDWIENEIKSSLKIRDTKGKSSFLRRSGIVHRLDKDTSGLLIVAKTEKAFKNLQKQFKKRQVRKKYLALVHGKVKPKKGNINLPIARRPSNRKRFAVRINGKSAYTEYKRIRSHRKKFSFVELSPRTGRTHQLRVHLKHIGFPIVSDPYYLGSKRLEKDKKICKRLFLHASFLSFLDPENGKRVFFKSELPQYLKNVIEKIKVLDC